MRAGDVVEPAVDVAMSHENAALVINQFLEVYEGTGRQPKVWDPSKIVIIFDHRVPAESAKTATNQKKIRDFAATQGIAKFHDVRGDEGGICHQILPENGYVRPGSVVVGTDSHTTTHGALGAFAFGIGATEMAAVWALGNVLNVEVPRSLKVVGDRDGSRGGWPEGFHPPPDRSSDGKRGQLPGHRVPRRRDPADADVGAPGDLQHGGRSGRDGRHRAARRGDPAVP